MENKTFKHGEAFCLMQYQNLKTKKVVLIWNSRDGVTPFCCNIEDQEHQHVNWKLDLRIPNYIPVSGNYIWRNYTEEEAREAAEKFYVVLQENWEKTLNPEAVKASIGDKEEFIAKHIKELLESNEPFLEKVK